MRTQIYLQTITWFILLDFPIVLIIILQYFCFCAVGLDASQLISHSFPRALLSENCSHLRIGNAYLQTPDHIVHILLFHGGEKCHESKDLA